MTTVRTTNGETIEIRDDLLAVGAQKDVYLTADGHRVVAFYRSYNPHSLDRLLTIAGVYRERIFVQDYWKRLFCWPEAVVVDGRRYGVVVPVYAPCFFFEYGSKNNDVLGLRGREKVGKWFASASHRKKYLDERERGDWKSYLEICKLISRAVRRLHAAGLAHSDLSLNNVLVDPLGKNACIIDLDGLVVPGKFPPEVAGTPEFIAPEVMASLDLPPDNPEKKLPSVITDRHALSVMVYMYLFYRHPLQGGKVHHPDPVTDEKMLMGTKALFIEHPTDVSNRPNLKNVRQDSLPWADVERIPYKRSGPYLSALFEKAFIDGLHQPGARPTADEWEKALENTMDLLLPCHAPHCEQKFFVFEDDFRPQCPFCRTPWTSGDFVYLHFYKGRDGRFVHENKRMIAIDGAELGLRHVKRDLNPDELLGDNDTTTYARVFRDDDAGNWKIKNLKLPELHDLDQNSNVPVGADVTLYDGKKLILSLGEQPRLVYVQIVSGRHLAFPAP
jgi:serine/threonine protein kinase